MDDFWCVIIVGKNSKYYNKILWVANIGNIKMSTFCSISEHFFFEIVGKYRKKTTRIRIWWMVDKVEVNYKFM